MMFIFGLAFVVLLLFSGVLRMIVLGFMGLIGAGGALLILMFIWLMFTGDREPQPQAAHVETAADYRAAQAAVAKATGRPCDYACKERIADEARLDLHPVTE